MDNNLNLSLASNQKQDLISNRSSLMATPKDPLGYVVEVDRNLHNEEYRKHMRVKHILREEKTDSMIDPNSLVPATQRSYLIKEV